jgi:putative ABC transport system substrate-binding protein
MSNRRELIVGLAGAAAWPLVTRAQQAAMPVIGYLSGRSSKDSEANVRAFRRGLAELGYVEGTNVSVVYRWAEGQYDRQPVLAAELIRLPVNVMCVFNLDSALAAKQLSAAVPIVFAMSADPVKYGLVISFNRPGGNITGVSFLNSQLIAKQLELLHQLVPQPAVLALLVNPSNANADSVHSDAQKAAIAVGRKLLLVKAASASEIDQAFEELVRQRIGGLQVSPDPFFDARTEQLIGLAARHALPTIYALREFPAAGGLASYGSSITNAFRLAGVYAGRILKGEKPSELPVQQPTKLELAINMKTARGLGLTVPEVLLATADEVIE